MINQVKDYKIRVITEYPYFGSESSDLATVAWHVDSGVFCYTPVYETGVKSDTIKIEAKDDERIKISNGKKINLKVDICDLTDLSSALNIYLKTINHRQIYHVIEDLDDFLKKSKD